MTRKKMRSNAEPPAAQDSNGGEKSFEDVLGELERIVRDLEGGGIPLEKALASYERGIACLKHCQGILMRAEKRLEILVPSGEESGGGNAAAGPEEGKGDSGKAATLHGEDEEGLGEAGGGGREASFDARLDEALGGDPPHPR